MEGKEEAKSQHHHEVVIDVEEVKKNFVLGSRVIQALKDVTLQVRSTDFLVIFGPSGCGKSTLLNIILGLDKPTKGTVKVRDTNIYNLDEDQRATFRAKKMGMVHQMPYWIKSLNAIENVALPLIIEGGKEKNAMREARKTMQELGIIELSRQIPTQLSGGEQQKVGLARALVSDPWILLADEPTGNLDSKSGDEIMSLFKFLNQKHKRTIILVTHNEEYWDNGTRRIEMKDGEIIRDTNHNSNLKMQISK